MAIGDDLQILLGMVPIRDRAGIARGTMADAASAAASKDGAMDGARPPAFALPPGMITGSGQGDVQLPENVPTSYASGKGGAIPPSFSPQAAVAASTPVPSERVVASGPASAPPPEVRRNSDLILAAMEAQQRKAKMQQIFQSIGMIVGGLRGEHVGGGGAAAGGPDMGSLASVLEMRSKEDAQERAVADYMLTHPHTSKEHATTLYEQGEMKGRNSREGLKEEMDLKNTAGIKERLLANLDHYAPLAGMDKDAAREEITHNPAGFLAKVDPQHLTTLQQGQIANTKAQSGIDAWNAAKADKEGFLARNPGITRAELETALPSEPAFTKLLEGRAGAAGTLDEVGKADLARIEEARKPVQAAALLNASQIKVLQELWSAQLKTGSSMAEKLHEVAKTWAHMTGQPISNARQITELFQKEQLAAAIPQAKQLGSQPSNLDLKKSEEVQGGWATPAKTIKAILWLKERANNAAIEAHNAEVDRIAAANPAMRGAPTLRVDYAAPNRFMREVVAERWGDDYFDNLVAAGKQNSPTIRQSFERDAEKGVGPGVWDHMVKEAEARKAAETKK